MPNTTPDYLILIVQLDADDTRATSFARLPTAIDHALDGASPGLDLEKVFLLDTPAKIALMAQLEVSGIDYHTYVVDVRGELCQKDGCTRHARYANVVPI